MASLAPLRGGSRKNARLQRLSVGHLDQSCQVAFPRGQSLLPPAEGHVGKTPSQTLSKGLRGYKGCGGVILICISLVTNDVRQLVCLITFVVLFSLKGLCPFYVALLFFLCIYKVSLYREALRKLAHSLRHVLKTFFLDFCLLIWVMVRLPFIQ